MFYVKLIGDQQVVDPSINGLNPLKQCIQFKHCG